MARLLDDYPEVFDAYWVAAVAGPSAKGRRQSFRERRESGRDSRMRVKGR